MPLFRITLAYDGTDFEGWQYQRRGRRPVRTVQGVVEAALAQLNHGQRVRVDSAGRTDAGVHALGQVASFELAREIAPEELQRVLNKLMDTDVRVLEAALAPADFHARRSATGKLYRYLIDTSPVQLPERRRVAAHAERPLDHEAMKEATRLFLGRQDFTALASRGGGVLTTVRCVTRVELTVGVGEMVLECEADGFLRKMVRSLVGGLLAVGRGERTLAQLEGDLHSRDRKRWPPPAPAHGLVLVRVHYPATAARVVG